MDGERRPISGMANGGVVVHVLPSATAEHLRHMAALLVQRAREMEGTDG